MRKFLKGLYGCIGAIVAGVIVTLISDWLKGDSAFSGLQQLWMRIVRAMSLGIPLWVVLITIIILITAFYLVWLAEKKSKTRRKNVAPQIPDFVANYTSRMYEGILWEWQWERYKDGWYITDLHPCCPNDGTRLTMYFQCPRCNKNYTKVQYCDTEKLRLLIEDDVKKGLYAKSHK